MSSYLVCVENHEFFCKAEHTHEMKFKRSSRTPNKTVALPKKIFKLKSDLFYLGSEIPKSRSVMVFRGPPGQFATARKKIHLASLSK